MRIILDINEKLLKEAKDLFEFKTNDELVEAGLHTLITKESSKRLATLGGSVKDASAPLRVKEL